MGVGFKARDETRDSQTWGVMELLARRRGRAWPVAMFGSEKQPMYAYPVAVEVLDDEVEVMKVD